MNLDDVSAAALALPGVRQSTVSGRRRWTVSGRLLARELDDANVLVRTGFDEREELLRDHPAVFHVPPRFDQHMAVAMRLSPADADVTAAVLSAAWRLQTAE